MKRMLPSLIVAPMFVAATLSAPTIEGAPRNAPYEKGERAGIEYVHGGVGQKALRTLREMDERYDLKVVFTDGNERFLASVEVVLESLDEDRQLRLTTEGPVLLANLPDGRYRLEARIPGREPATQTFTSRGEDRTRLTMRLPRS